LEKSRNEIHRTPMKNNLGSEINNGTAVG
jgi:hypothetical protein